jgi:hypothetical protein
MSDDDLKGAHDDLVSENALLGGFVRKDDFALLAIPLDARLILTY